MDDDVPAVGLDGDRALEAVRERCGRGDPVTLHLEGGSRVSVPCAGPPPPSPAAMAFPVQD